MEDAPISPADVLASYDNSSYGSGNTLYSSTSGVAPDGYGQSFTVSSTYDLTDFVVRGNGAGGAGGNGGTSLFQVEFGTVTGGVFTATDTEVTGAQPDTVFTNNPTIHYYDFTLGTPDLLVPGTTYAVDISTSSQPSRTLRTIPTFHSPRPAAMSMLAER